MTFGRLKRELLKELRIRAGLTGRDLAKKIGISAPYYSGLECGNRQPSPKMVIKIGSTLKVSPDSLWEGRDERDPLIRRIVDILESMPESDRAAVLRFAARMVEGKPNE